MQKAEGRIIKGIGGFYYIELDIGLIECRARGSFRNNDKTLYVGDIVSIEYDEQTLKGVVTEISPRKNVLVRPSVSNVDKLYIVCSTVFPSPNLFNIDKLIAIAVHNNIKPVIVISKTDLSFEGIEEIKSTYSKAGIEVFETSSQNNEGAEKILSSLENQINVFTGNSGVGKSTLINQMFPNLLLKTGEVSKKLSRGKHTTRHVELFKLENGGYIADTPGFSSIDFEGEIIIKKDEVESCFEEFDAFLGECRFPDCRHIGEKDCAIKKAVENGKIASSRYESYVSLYKEAEKIKEWDLKPAKDKR